MLAISLATDSVTMEIDSFPREKNLHRRRVVRRSEKHNQCSSLMLRVLWQKRLADSTKNPAVLDARRGPDSRESEVVPHQVEHHCQRTRALKVTTPPVRPARGSSSSHRRTRLPSPLSSSIRCPLRSDVALSSTYSSRGVRLSTITTSCTARSPMLSKRMVKVTM